MITPPTVYNNADDSPEMFLGSMAVLCVCAVRLEGLILLRLEHHWMMMIKMMRMMTVVVGIKC